MSKKRKIIRFIDRAIDKGLTVLLLIVLGIGIYFIYDAYFVFNAAGMESTEQYLSNAQIQAEYKDAIAWITLDQTSVSYPITQGENNMEYLNKNANGEYSLSGAIFLDSRNNPKFTDDYSLLYGHHMSGGYMMGALDEFANKEYFDTHQTGQLRVLEGDKKYKVDVFAYVQTDASVGLVFEFAGSAGDLKSYIKAQGLQYRDPKEGRLLALSTCKSPLSTERLVLFCTLSDWTKADDARLKALEVGPDLLEIRAKVILLNEEWKEKQKSKEQ